LHIPFLSTLQFNRNICPIVKQFIADKSVDVVDCQGSGPGAAFAALARAMKNSTHFVYHAHDCVASELDEVLRRRLTVDPRFIIRTKLLARYEEKAMSASDLIVSTSEAAKTGIITHYGIAPDIIHVVGLGIPDDYALNFRRSESDPPCFLTFGAGIRRDLQSFLRALALLRNTYGVHARAVIVRDENRRDRVLAQKLKLDATFYNSITDNFLKRLYASCTALIMPSFREGFCLPVIEAGAFAKPTIASRAGSLPDLIQDRVNGILLRDLRPETIADAMRLIVSDNRLRESLGSNAEELAENYRISNTTRQLIELYNSKLN
jgi:glycosyltransferase involved in cell wall biosynthesis